MFKVSEYWISVDVGSSRQAVQDGWFEEDNPVELLCWARDKDYYTVLARMQQVKNKGFGRQKVEMSEEELQEIENEIAINAMMGR